MISGYDTTQDNKGKKKIGLYETKKLLHSKGNSYPDEMATYQMGEIFVNHVSDKRSFLSGSDGKESAHSAEDLG